MLRLSGESLLLWKLLHASLIQMLFLIWFYQKSCLTGKPRSDPPAVMVMFYCSVAFYSRHYDVMQLYHTSCIFPTIEVRGHAGWKLNFSTVLPQWPDSLSCSREMFVTAGQQQAPRTACQKPFHSPARLTEQSSMHIIWDCSNRCDCLNWACYNHICLFTPSLWPLQMYHCKIGDCKLTWGRRR